MPTTDAKELSKHFLTQSFGEEETDYDEPNKHQDTQNWDHILR